MDENLASTRGMIHFDSWQPLPEPQKPTARKAGKHMSGSKNIFWRKYAVVIIGAALFTLYTVGLSSWVNWKAEKRGDEKTEVALAEYYQKNVVAVWEGPGEAPEEKVKVHEGEQVKVVQTKVLTDEASRESFINQEIDAVTPVIAKLATDAQKQTELGCFIARHLNPGFPNSFQQLAEQAQQWPLYDGKDRTYSQHDRDLTEAMLRPYLENGVIPSGLTQDMVYATWSQNDLVLRDSWESSATMNTWRYTG